MNSIDVRTKLVEALRLDLVGPSNDHAFARELLPESPSRWYLTGFLVPVAAPVQDKCDETSNEEIAGGSDVGGTDDANAPDRDAARKSFLPSSMGLSVLVPAGASRLTARVAWGEYIYEGPDSDPEPEDHPPVEEEPPDVDAGADSEMSEKIEKYEAGDGSKQRVRKGYRRHPREEIVTITLAESGGKAQEVMVPNGDGLSLTVTLRDVSGDTSRTGRLPKGTRSLSVFLVNKRVPNPDRAYRAFVFQAELALTTSECFVARPDLRDGLAGEAADDWDEQVADLQYRDVFEYAVGHGVSATACPDNDVCHTVKTTWVPSAEVERVVAADIPGAELGMEALGDLKDGDDAKAKLGPLVALYRVWIEMQRATLSELEQQQVTTAKDLLVQAGYAATRIEAGIDALKDPEVLEAFRIANRAMGLAARQREGVRSQSDPLKVSPPRWRPFQLAFVLMSLRGIVDPLHADRQVVDLLFFPTGGGKTEAYLGLAGFTMVLRRLRNPGIRSAGMSVLMRYTLRLLTLDQLGRAAALMCALELEREKDTQKLGEWPFEIGLWVGSAATPNRMGAQGDTGAGADRTAYRKWRHFMANERNPAPIPIENCPWCGEKFTRNSFRLEPNPKQPANLTVRCVNYQCAFSRDRALPIIGVDEPIYRRLPAFLIATVDKFAALPWTGQTGSLFGLVDRYDAKGFYGPCDPGQGKALGGPLPPPELIIQDELHLISGPLGTIAGVYETVIEALSTRDVVGKPLKPKIIASTATVRRAEPQIRALFGRSQVAVFPQPGPNRRDSFFAHVEASSVTPARLYLGLAAPGRSLKVLLLRSSLALLGAAQAIYEAQGGKRNHTNPVDPYMTLLGYFNSLRELGGSRRIVEDEVRTRVAQYSRRRRVEPEDRLFSDRSIGYEVLELTSRVSTGDVAAAKRRLALPFDEDESVDVALATNMISVGLDIVRLGLMVVLGQPKTSAEYIQATSRVGRDPLKPGLVVTLLNVHKPRDRSHYERFEMYHASFYRAVEAASVTPFSPRALDRALAAALVGLCRHGQTDMTAPLGAGQILAVRASLETFAAHFAERAQNHKAMSVEDGQALHDKVLARCRSLLDDWLNIAQEFQRTNTRLQYQQYEAGGAKRLLYDFLDPELSGLTNQQRRFRANRSMRDVESPVDLRVKNLNDWEDRK
jgi:hypothetical protein